jgi:hypothetical protein
VLADRLQARIRRPGERQGSDGNGGNTPTLDQVERAADEDNSMSSPVLLQYARTAMGLSLGARFGRHELLTASGSGSRGVACQTPGARLAPHAAIEFGPPQIDSDPHFRGHFDCEAKAIAALNRPPARGLPVYGPRERHRPCAHGVVSGIPRR